MKIARTAFLLASALVGSYAINDFTSGIKGDQTAKVSPSGL
jgi:hypothetical protein